jgi:hypothetical protein
MDGSYASGEHNTRRSSQVPAEHHIQIQGASKSLDRQWNICKMLCEFLYPPSAIVNSTSSDEQASRVSKWTYSARDEDKNAP